MVFAHVRHVRQILAYVRYCARWFSGNCWTLYKHGFLNTNNNVSMSSSTYSSFAISDTHLPLHLNNQSFMPALEATKIPPEQKLSNELYTSFGNSNSKKCLYKNLCMLYNNLMTYFSFYEFCFFRFLWLETGKNTNLLGQSVSWIFLNIIPTLTLDIVLFQL